MKSKLWLYREKTKTAGLFVHYMGIGPLTLSKSAGYIFDNAYLDDHSREFTKKVILLKFVPDTKYIDDIPKLVKLFSAIDHYMIDDAVVLVLEIPKKFFNDLELFKAGQYSKLDKKRIETIFKEDDLRYNIVFKTQQLREEMEEELGVIIPKDAELAQPPEPALEILNYDVSRLSKTGWPNSNLPITRE